MYLKPLKREQFDCLVPILQRRLEESGIADITSPEYAISKLESAYDMRAAGVYVDDEKSPKHCLIMSHFPGGMFEGVVAYINLIYTVPEERGDGASMKTMLRTAENYARLNGARFLQGSSWMRGGKSTDSMWLEDGYILQEKTFIKPIT
jgi:hypothetical protein